MNNCRRQIAPQKYARIGGIAYLVIIVAGLLGELYIRNPVIVSGSASATSKNLMANPFLWRVGVAGDLVMHACDIIVMLVFYLLLRSVNSTIALFALLSNLIQTAVLVANKMNLLLPLFLLDDSVYLNAFSPQQLQALSYVAIKAHGYGFGVGLIFFGMSCLALGYLIYRSGYFPKILGVLMQIAGACYLINSFILILSPGLMRTLSPAILIPPFIAELSLCLWLIIKGVNMTRWQERQTDSD